MKKVGKPFEVWSDRQERKLMLLSKCLSGRWIAVYLDKIHRPATEIEEFERFDVNLGVLTFKRSATQSEKELAVTNGFVLF